MAYTIAQIRERNQEINKAFNQLFRETRETFGSVHFQGLYAKLSERYNLSEMQIRRIVKGY